MHDTNKGTEEDLRVQAFLGAFLLSRYVAGPGSPSGNPAPWG